MFVGGPELLQLSEALKGGRQLLRAERDFPGNRKGTSYSAPGDRNDSPGAGVDFMGMARASSPVGKTRELAGRMLSAFSRSAAPRPAGSLRCVMQKAVHFYSCRV